MAIKDEDILKDMFINKHTKIMESFNPLSNEPSSLINLLTTVRQFLWDIYVMGYIDWKKQSLKEDNENLH